LISSFTVEYKKFTVHNVTTNLTLIDMKVISETGRVH